LKKCNRHQPYRGIEPQDLTNAIAQAKNDGHILSILKGYTKDKIGREASKAIKKLKIKTSTEYRRRYKEDPKLPSDLAWTYKDFPGW
jgi:hypothetical protein